MIREQDRKGVVSITISIKYVFCSIILALLLCLSHITGNTLLILGCLASYMVLVAWCCSHDFTLPILLFFLPWSPIMRLSPDSYSFYTFGLVFVCLISIFKKGGAFRIYQIKAGLLILFISLFSKLLDGSALSFDYIAFLMMVVLFPTVKEESVRQKYDFFQSVVFFSLGVIISALCAMYFADYANIRKFVRVDSYLTIIRRCGFYGDPNFYVAHILAALGGVLSLILQFNKRKYVVLLGVITLFLLYCGFLSGSKSFALISAIIILFWIFAILKLRGRAGLKVALLACSVWVCTYIASSLMFSDLIGVIITRFLNTRDLDSFTTGRIGLWKNYIGEILSNIKVFLLGKGFTNIKINGRGSHNTIIQIFYQFGLLGSIAIIYWVNCFFQNIPTISRRPTHFNLKLFMVAVGCFAPWLAIDALFFDEFFLLQMYMCLAINELGQNEYQRVPTIAKIDNQQGGKI